MSAIDRQILCATSYQFQGPPEANLILALIKSALAGVWPLSIENVGGSL
jgi:hypothetical protein